MCVCVRADGGGGDKLQSNKETRRKREQDIRMFSLCVHTHQPTSHDIEFDKEGMAQEKKCVCV